MLVPLKQESTTEKAQPSAPEKKTTTKKKAALQSSLAQQQSALKGGGTAAFKKPFKEQLMSHKKQSVSPMLTNKVIQRQPNSSSTAAIYSGAARQV